MSWVECLIHCLLVSWVECLIHYLLVSWVECVIHHLLVSWVECVIHHLLVSWVECVIHAGMNVVACSVLVHIRNSVVVAALNCVEGERGTDANDASWARCVVREWRRAEILIAVELILDASRICLTDVRGSHKWSVIVAIMKWALVETSRRRVEIVGRLTTCDFEKLIFSMILQLRCDCSSWPLTMVAIVQGMELCPTRRGHLFSGVVEVRVSKSFSNRTNDLVELVGFFLCKVLQVSQTLSLVVVRRVVQGTGSLMWATQHTTGRAPRQHLVRHAVSWRWRRRVVVFRRVPSLGRLRRRLLILVLRGVLLLWAWDTQTRLASEHVLL